MERQGRTSYIDCKKLTSNYIGTAMNTEANVQDIEIKNKLIKEIYVHFGYKD